MSTKDKAKVVKPILFHYHKGNNDNDEYRDVINNTLDLMPTHLSAFLLKDFALKYDRDWWREYYSRSNYYRTRAQAIDAFLNCLTVQRML